MSSPLSRWLLARFGAPASGRTLHRGALGAQHGGDLELALRLFELAARAYRRDLDVRGLAALRVHEGIVRLRSAEGADASAIAAEVERRLARFDEIESLEPPFAPVPARELAAVIERAAEPAGRAA